MGVGQIFGSHVGVLLSWKIFRRGNALDDPESLNREENEFQECT